MRFSAAFPLAVTLLLAPPPDTPPIWAGLPPGPLPVGFAARIERDAQRRLDGGPRPVQVACWFPARAGTGTPLVYRDYFDLSAGERHEAAEAERASALDGEKRFFASVGVDGALVDRWMAQPVFARLNAAALPDRRPLVLVAQGNGQSAHHQAVLSEFLASHGFVVCTTPSQVRLGDGMESEADVLPSARMQAADLTVAERAARSRFAVSAHPAALVGHSFGARSALLYAQTHPAPALVSLDGGIGAADARGWLDTAAFDRDTFNTPVLHVFEQGDLTPDLTLLRSLHASDRLAVRIDAMRHIDFTSLGFGAAAVGGLTGAAPQALADKVREVAMLTLQFLEAHLNGSAEARQRLDRGQLPAWASRVPLG